MGPVRRVAPIGIGLWLSAAAAASSVWAADGVVAYRPSPPACEAMILTIVDGGPHVVLRRIAGNSPLDGQLISGVDLIKPGEQSLFNRGAGGGPSAQRLIATVEAVVDSEHEALRALRLFCPPPPPAWDGN